jgi:diguanylate cyclase (GGDEF)-like protein
MGKDATDTRVNRQAQMLLRAVARGESCLVLIHGPGLGARIGLDQAELSIGRDESCDLVVPMDDVSRHHCRVRMRDGRATLADLDSTNGTFVNDREVPPGTEFALRSGDLIRLGSAIFKFLQGGNVESLYHEAIYRTIIIDGLTQIHNRRYLSEFLERELSRCIRHDRPLSLILFDLDHFKAVNDEHGHLGGDAVLREVAAALAPSIRKEDCFARFGGEEFAIVPLECSHDRAVTFAEKVRRTIDEHRFIHDANLIRVTISAGVAARDDSRDPNDLIARADAKLYEAKRAGRNRVVG